MEITLNGQKTLLDNKCNVAELLQRFQLDTKKIAVEKNLEIVSKSSYSDTIIDEGDVLEIIHFIGGG